MNVSSKREGRRAAQGIFANGLKAVLAAVLTVVLVLQGSNLQAYADDLLGAQAPEDEVIVSDVVADDETEGEKDDAVVTDEVETESDDEDVVTETEDETPVEEAEPAEEAETPKATTTSVEPQVLSTTSAQSTNASTRAGESYTTTVGGSVEITGEWSIRPHSWSVSDDSIAKIEENGNRATVTGLAEGTVKVTHKWGVIFGGSEEFWVTVKGVNVYFYTLIPNIKHDPNADPNTQWNGMGVGTITGIDSPANHEVETTLYEGDELNRLKITYPADLAQTTITVDGKKYTYAEPGSEEAKQDGHYTIEWTELKVANGANAGANLKNPVVATGTNTYHLDGTVTLIDEAKIQVGFRVKQPGAEDFDQPIPEYYTLYTKGVSLSDIAYPHYEGDKEIGPGGYTYVFDGWYADAACTEKVDFGSGDTLSVDTTFYGRYVPDRDVLTYKPNGGTGEEYFSYGWVSTGNTAKVQDNHFRAPAGKVFDSWNTDPNGNGTKYYPDGTYTLNPDVDDVLYAQWRDDLSGFTVTGGTWYYDGDTHGVTVSGVKKGDTLTFKLINDEGKMVYESEESVDSDTGTYTSACGAKDVADSGTMRVTLTRGSTTSESKTADLTINRRQITFTSATLSKTYDGTNEFKKNGVTVSSNLEPDNGGGWAKNEGATYDLTAECPKNVGTTVTNTFDVHPTAGTNLDNYDITLNYGTLTVTKATITVTAGDQTKVEGERDPQLTTTYSGAKNGETPGWTGSAVREDGEKPGDYKIMRGTLALADNPDGKFKADNYDLEFIPGTLTITAADDGDDDTPVTPVDPVDPGDDDDNPGGGGDNPADNTNPGGGTGVTPGGGATTGGGTNPVPVAATTGDDADDAEDAEDEEAIEEDETPLADGAETDADGEEIADDDTPLTSGETNDQTCMMHWAMLAGIAASAVYFVLSAVNTRRATSKLASFEDDVLGRR